jgi:hypothetical protein
MLQFPLDDLLDEQACSDFLLRVLHPDGLCCPHGHRLPADPRQCHRPRILDNHLQGMLMSTEGDIPKAGTVRHG